MGLEHAKTHSNRTDTSQAIQSANYQQKQKQKQRQPHKLVKSERQKETKSECRVE